MYLWVDPTIKGDSGLGVDLVPVELESGDGERESFRDIPPCPDNLSAGIVCISDEGRCGFPDNCHSSDAPSRRHLHPFAGFENYPVIRNEAGRRTEHLLLSELVVDVYGSVGVFRAHLVNGGDIECVFHRNLQIYRPYIDSVLIVEHACFLLCEDDVSRYRLDSELRCYRHIGFRYRKVEYEGEERKGYHKANDEEKHMGIPSYLLVFVYLRLLFGKKHEFQEEFVYLVAGILEKGEVVTENVILGILLFKFDIVIPLKKADPEGFPEPLEFVIVRYEREPFHWETIEEELEVQIIAEVDIAFHLYLNLGRFHFRYLFEYLYEGVVFIDDNSFFIHIGRLCSGVYGL